MNQQLFENQLIMYLIAKHLMVPLALSEFVAFLCFVGNKFFPFDEKEMQGMQF